MYFRVSDQSGEPVAVARLADNEFVLGFRGIRKEFGIEEDSADGRMLEAVAQALNYVSGIRVGDPLPTEMLTGEASWEPGEDHRRIAYQRLTMQLVTWLTGDEHLITDPTELAQVAEDPQIKRQVNEAFGEAAERLGIGRERKQEVVDFIHALSGELAYIEALRDRFGEIKGMAAKIQGLRRLYGHERSVMEVADQVARLAERAVSSFQEPFEQIDAQTGEIMAALKNIDSQIDYIRQIRDELHHRLMVWDKLLDQWRRTEIKVSPDKPDLLRRTYQFLAPRFMQVNEWVLVTKPERQVEALKQKEAGKQVKYKGGVMKW